MEIYNILVIKSVSKDTLKQIHDLFVNKIINQDYSKLFENEPVLVSALTAGQEKKVKEGKLDAEKHLDCGAIFDDECGAYNSFTENLGKEEVARKDMHTVRLVFDSKRPIDKLVKLISSAYKVVIYQEWEDVNGKEAGFQHFTNGRKEYPFHYGSKISLRLSKYARDYSNIEQRQKVTLEYLMDEYDLPNNPEQFNELYEGECDKYLTKSNLENLNASLESGDWEWFEKIVYSN
jgi:hypothetical protein